MTTFRIITPASEFTTICSYEYLRSYYMGIANVSIYRLTAYGTWVLEYSSKGWRI